MTKQELINRILDDMDRKSDASRDAIEKKWSGWLNRQSKTELEQIAKNRGITE